MPVFTFPPDPAIALHRHLLRRKSPVLCWVPFLRQIRELTGKIIETWDNLPSGTDRTTLAVGSGTDGSFPFVPFLTTPPGFSPSTRHKVIGRKCAVFRRMPLFCQFRMGRSQIVYPLRQCSVRANRAAAAIYPAFHLSLPFVAFLTAPPDDLFAPR